MREPRDQGLFFTVFFAVALTTVLAVWVILPPQKHHGEGEEEGEAGTHPKKVLSREGRVAQAEAVLTKAEEVLTRLEKAKDEKPKKDSGKKASANKK